MAMTTVTTRPYVLASETPLLRGEKNLCDFLKKMDEEEIPFLANDDKQETVLLEGWSNGPRKIGAICVGVGVACIIGAGYYFYTSSGKGNESGREKKDISALITGMGGIFGTIFGFLDPIRAKKEMEKKLNSEIIGERICRLKDKIRKIDMALQENSANVNKDQVLKVKDYFELRLAEMLIEKTNVLNIKVT